MHCVEPRMRTIGAIFLDAGARCIEKQWENFVLLAQSRLLLSGVTPSERIEAHLCCMPIPPSVLV